MPALAGAEVARVAAAGPVPAVLQLLELAGKGTSALLEAAGASLGVGVWAARGAFADEVLTAAAFTTGPVGEGGIALGVCLSKSCRALFSTTLMAALGLRAGGGCRASGGCTGDAIAEGRH